jgi:hypothetical protein
MSAPANAVFPVGMKHVRVYALNSFGYPAATAASAVVYEGLQIVGAKAFELSIPDARRISHTGDDRVLAQDILPRQEPSSGTLRTATNPHSVYAAMSSTLKAVIGEASLIGYATDEQGDEPALGLLMYQQAKEQTTGSRVWRSYQMPSVQAIINPTGMTAEAPEFTYNLLPTAVGHHLFGKAFAAGVEGFLEAEIVESLTYNVPHVVAWLGDNVVTKLLFHASRQAVSTAKIHGIYSMHQTTGVVTDITATATKETDGVTPLTKPAAGELVMCFYEYAA